MYQLHASRRIDGEVWQGIETRTSTHMIHIYLPQVYQKIEMKFERCGNCRSRNLTYKFCTSMHLHILGFSILIILGFILIK